MSFTARHLLLGRSGEDAAARYLRGQGMRILHRNWRSRGLELDIVCRDQKTLVFAEVKTRSPNARGVPGQALTRAKRSSLARAACLYLSEHDLWESPCRFDLLSVTPVDGSFSVDHLKNAFTLDDTAFNSQNW
ncbi:putative endonuclease [Paucidesulfovibrio gracilis DSM 16080]|jgi:putative endonuclease|uniref:UPF0102 protein SAMN02745704_02221 n=1 Tax=Paucidesulfovibrio gracilis DSM 16080 TaxID=1121449 RepID=A0A1T4XMT6_9BACT|nr:YraN family protein [Paucidesulfovibrio gracilis]SKA90431.1 putative endonuclease [Paucidesulfovibrio gracilis DSM 16080]